MSNVIADISPDTIALANALAATKVGGKITYDQLSKAIGRDVRKGAWHLLHTAFGKIRKENGAIFSNVRNVGYQRLHPTEANKIGADARRTIRRRSRVARKAMISVTERTNDMPPAAARKINQEISSLALIEHLARDQTMEKVVPPEESDMPMPVAVITSNFLKSLKAI